MNHCLATHIADIAWNKLIPITSYKTELAGKCQNLLIQEIHHKCALYVVK